MKLIGPKKTPLDVVLLQEIQRYNVLLRKTRNSLNDLQLAIKGLILMSHELEEIFFCVFEGRVPSIWLMAYPSLKLLGAWTRDLVNRVGLNHSRACPVLARRLHFPNRFPYRRITDVSQDVERVYRHPVLGVHRFYHRRDGHC